MVKTLREALGEDYDIMLDCWQSWDLNYAVKVTSYIEEYQPRWLEEVAMPDRIDTYRQLKQVLTFLLHSLLYTPLIKNIWKNGIPYINSS